MNCDRHSHGEDPDRAGHGQLGADNAAGECEQATSSPSGPSLVPICQSPLRTRGPGPAGPPSGLDTCFSRHLRGRRSALYPLPQRSEAPPGTHLLPGSRSRLTGTTLSPSVGRDQPGYRCCPARSCSCTCRAVLTESGGLSARPPVHGAALTPQGAVEEMRGR